MSAQNHPGLHQQKQPTADMIPSPPTSDNEHDFSLTALLQPTMTLEQIKIIEMALAKIKSKRDALLSSEQQGGGGNTILSYDWTMVAKQMAKALTTTCNSNNSKNQQPLTKTSTPSTITTSPPPTSSSHNGNSSMTGLGSTNTSVIPTTDTNCDHKPPTDVISTTITTPPSSASCVASSSPIKKDMVKDKLTRPEPLTEMKDGVEWVSFVYSHHRVVRRYRIRTDLDTVEVASLDEQFKNDNCVYPRANLPREAYQGNRWSYETECNTLGWKLAYLNMDEIAGKRGLIQRAVDSYRNRYPSMRSRRVARQEKLLKGTLRKRKQSPVSGDDIDGPPPCKSPHLSDSPYHNDESTRTTLCYSSSPSPTTAYGKIPNLYPLYEKSTKAHPKTVMIDDRGVKCRIRINIDSIDLSAIDDNFRKSNCVYPRAMNMAPTSNLTQRRQDEAKCNEIGWKLAWLNPKHLAGKKNLLQRILDIYRIKFVPHLTPRQSSHPLKLHTELETKPTPLTAEALAAHHQQQEQQAANNGLSYVHHSDSVRYVCKNNDPQRDNDDNDTIYTGTTDSLDFQDCFSPPPETVTASSTIMDDFPTFDDPILAPMLTTDLHTDFSSMVIVPPPPPPMMGDEYFESVLDPLASPPTQSLSATLTSSSDFMDDVSCHLSVDSCHTSPSQRYLPFGSYHDETFTYPMLVKMDGNHHHHHHHHYQPQHPDDDTNMMTDMYIFDTKSKPPSSTSLASSHHLLPTDIFAAQDMDWTADVKDCILADLHSDVLVHQLFLT